MMPLMYHELELLICLHFSLETRGVCHCKRTRVVLTPFGYLLFCIIKHGGVPLPGLCSNCFDGPRHNVSSYLETVNLYLVGAMYWHYAMANSCPK